MAGLGGGGAPGGAGRRRQDKRMCVKPERTQVKRLILSPWGSKPASQPSWFYIFISVEEKGNRHLPSTSYVSDVVP